MKKFITIIAFICFAGSSLVAEPVDTVKTADSALQTAQAPVKLNKLLGVKPKTTNSWTKIKDLFL